jgi:hypothetical protein
MMTQTQMAFYFRLRLVACVSLSIRLSEIRQESSFSMHSTASSLFLSFFLFVWDLQISNLSHTQSFVKDYGNTWQLINSFIH